MINKNIEEITKEDLQALVDNEVIEHKSIEYKQALPENSDLARKEFLADVTSFANASGGDIVFGLVEDRETGKPKLLTGLSIENVDQEILRLDQIIRNGVQPRIPSVIWSKPIQIQESKISLVLRVQKSWISPHRVTLGGHDKFYSRSSNGKYPLDVGELRIAFNLSETITEKIRNFRMDRISKVLANETPVPLNDNPKIVLHLIPITSLNLTQSYDISKIASNPGCIETISSEGGYYRYNLDGFITFSRGQDGKSSSYAQVFRNGIFEAVDGHYISLGRERAIIYITYERALIKSLKGYLSLSKLLNVEMPIFVYLELLGVKGYKMGLETWRFDELDSIDRDMLVLPEILVESYEEKAERILKPCFDSIWNACGLPRALNYNENGEWAPMR